MSFVAGFVISGTTYVVLHLIFPAQKVRHFVEDTTTTSAMLVRSYRLRIDGAADEAEAYDRESQGMRAKDHGETFEVGRVSAPGEKT